MEETFGFDSEILMVYSSYDSLEPRTIKALEHIILESPANGRVNNTMVFLVSEMRYSYLWVNQYSLANESSRIIVAFDAEDLRGK